MAREALTFALAMLIVVTLAAALWRAFYPSEPPLLISANLEPAALTGPCLIILRPPPIPLQPNRKADA